MTAMLLAALCLGQVTAEDPNDPAFLIGKELRCPVCQGMPISDSPSGMAIDMMGQVRKMHAEGKSREEILNYFTRSYGDWVLLRPRTEGVGWFVWTLPPVGMLVAIALALRYRKRAPPATPHVPPTSDPYLDAVRKEVQS